MSRRTRTPRKTQTTQKSQHGHRIAQIINQDLPDPQKSSQKCNRYNRAKAAIPNKKKMKLTSIKAKVTKRRIIRA